MNPALQKLGYAPTDRVVVIHADDIGMCQATLPAYDNLLDAGLLSSASAMVSCAWFPAVAAYCRTHPSADMGVHLTLTSEWNAYRWGPISTGNETASLLDDEGYFPRGTKPIREEASVEGVRAESVAQIGRALAAGIEATHIDHHMGVLGEPHLLSLLVEVAQQYRLPWRELNPPAPRADETERQIRRRAILLNAASQGQPLFDAHFGLPLDQPHDQLALAKQIFTELPSGLSLVIAHPAVDTPELRALAPDWASRTANYEALISRELRNFMRQQGVQVIGFREIREAMSR